jgi:hypothetical protein
MAAEIEEYYTLVAKRALSGRQCCENMCLIRRTGDVDSAVLLVKECHMQLHNLDGKQKKDLIRQKVRGCVAGRGVHIMLLIY